MTNLIIRPYRPEDYEQLVVLYKYQEGALFGGQFDEDRDSAERINKLIAQAPNSILVAEREKEICGTVSLIKDPRTAWLFRFAANEEEIVTALYEEAAKILKAEGHKQVLVYSPTRDEILNKRYENLGFNKGGDFTCYWKPIS